MLRYALYPDTSPVSVSVRASRKNLVQISIIAPLGFAGGLARGLKALVELADGVKGETEKAHLRQRTKEARSMWNRRIRAIRREYGKLRVKGLAHRLAVEHLAHDYRWRDLSWSVSDFNRVVPAASEWNDALRHVS